MQGPNLFRDRSFLAMWSVALANGLGEKMFFVFLVLILTQHSTSNTMMSALSVAFAVPAVIFGSVAGVFVDRFSLKGLLVTSNLARAAFVLTLPLTPLLSQGVRDALARLPLPEAMRATLLALDYAWPLLGFAFGFALLTQFFNPTFMATIPAVVHKDQLMGANAVFMATMITTVIGGFALAEPIAGFVGLSRAHLTIVGLYTFAAVASLLIVIPPQPAREEKALFWAEWKSAFGYLLRNRTLLKGYLMAMSMFGTFAALNVLAISFARDFLKVSNFGIILAMAGAGMAIGAVIVGRFGKNLPKALWVRGGFVMVGVALLALALTRSLPVALGFALLIGVAGAFIDIPIATLIQESVEEAMRGKIFGVQGTLMYIASTLPMAIAGPFADLWGAPVVVAILGVVLLSFALLRLPETPMAQVSTPEAA